MSRKIVITIDEDVVNDTNRLPVPTVVLIPDGKTIDDGVDVTDISKNLGLQELKVNWQTADGFNGGKYTYTIKYVELDRENGKVLTHILEND